MKVGVERLELWQKRPRRYEHHEKKSTCSLTKIALAQFDTLVAQGLIPSEDQLGFERAIPKQEYGHHLTDYQLWLVAQVHAARAWWLRQITARLQAELANEALGTEL